MALIVLAVPMLLIACLIRVTSRGPSLIRQARVGRGGELFEAIKFRTMNEGTDAGASLTTGGDARVTTAGAFLRRFKLDELPQFWNVLRGDMSLVGPRPKLRQYDGIPAMPYRPGITGLATLAFCAEGEILNSVPAERRELFYMERIKPLKANLDVCYMCHATVASDARVIAATAVSCVAPGVVRRWLAGGGEEPSRSIAPDLAAICAIRTRCAEACPEFEEGSLL